MTTPHMQYSLRSLLIALTLAPPLIAFCVCNQEIAVGLAVMSVALAVLLITEVAVFAALVLVVGLIIEAIAEARRWADWRADTAPQSLRSPDRKMDDRKMKMPNLT